MKVKVIGLAMVRQTSSRTIIFTANLIVGLASKMIVYFKVERFSSSTDDYARRQKHDHS